MQVGRTCSIFVYQAQLWLDIGNEDLRAQVKTLQYELESIKQEREVTNLRHEKEVRDAQIRAEADFKRAQACTSSTTKTGSHSLLGL